jgi:AbrB family looped-hinge helix DNA binding protein
MTKYVPAQRIAGLTLHKANYRQSGNPAIRQSGNPAIRQSGNPAIRLCGFTVFPLFSIPAMCDHRTMTFHGFVAVQARGVVALPADVRRRLHLDESGAQVEITEREDGVLELRPALPIPADQRWFWQDRWQQREKEVDEHVAAGRVTVHDDGDAFLGHLDQLDAQAQAGESAPDAESQS